jgi:hypothetical protein
VNGVAAGFAGLARAVGPAFGGNLYAWSATNGLSFPIDYHFAFLLIAIGSIFGLVLSFSYKPNKEDIREPSVNTLSE